MTLPAIRLDANVSVAPQLAPEAMAEAAAAGFKSVINNRPDFEGGPTQPTNASIEAAARAAGLEYAFLPVAGQFPERPRRSPASANCWRRCRARCSPSAVPARAPASSGRPRPAR